MVMLDWRDMRISRSNLAIFGNVAEKMFGLQSSTLSGLNGIFKFSPKMRM